MKKLLNLLIALTAILSLYSCSQEDNFISSEELENNENVEKALLLADSIYEPITPIEVDSARLLEYIKFKEKYLSNIISDKINLTKKSLMTRSTYSEPYIESTVDDNIYAIRDMPVQIRAKGGGNTGNYLLATNGKGRELTFLRTSPRSSRVRPSSRPEPQVHKFYFRALPASTGVSYLLYSNWERTPISVGVINNDNNNPILYARQDESGSISSAAFKFYPASQKGYLVWQSESLIAQGSSGNWWDIYYKVAENRNNNKTGFSQYAKNQAQEWQLTPDQIFNVDNISFQGSYNTKIISSRDEKLRQAIDNPFSNTVIPESWLLFDKEVKEESTFMTKEGIHFNLSNNKKYRLPSAFKNNIITLPSQNSPANGIYSESKQYIDKKLDSFVKLNDMQPRERCEAVFSYTRYEIEVDFTVDISCVYASTNRKTTLKGVWRGVVYVDERKPVYYEFYNMDTNQLLETGYLDISNTTSATTKSAANVPTIKRKVK